MSVSQQPTEGLAVGVLHGITPVGWGGGGGGGGGMGGRGGGAGDSAKNCFTRKVLGFPPPAGGAAFFYHHP